MIDHEDDKRWDSPWPDETERAMAEDIALQCGEIYDPDPVPPSDADTEAEQRQELVQVAAVAVKAIETIDRRNRR